MEKMSSEEIRNKIKLFKSTWINKSTTNCYAYALGLDIPEKEICKHAFQPGIMAGYYALEEDYFSYEDLIKGLKYDLDFLRIESKEINPSDPIDLDAWKIALFIPMDIYCPPYLIADYHFLTCYPDNTWHHKYGYTNSINNIDDNARIISNPETCHLDGFVYDKALSLKLKK